MPGLCLEDLKCREAQVLASVKLVDDEYHKNIQRAAKYLVARGDGNMKYITQWTKGDYAGLTKWESQDGYPELVTIDDPRSYGF